MSIQFSPEDVRRFADWSADRNPLHVDGEFARQTHFGQQVVHGVLTVLNALRAAADTVGPERVRALDVEFRNAVVMGRPYEAGARREGADRIAQLSSADQLVLNVRTEVGAAIEPLTAPSPWTPAAGRPERDAPAAHGLDEFSRGLETSGTYRMRVPVDPVAAGAGLSHTQARVLALCSYVTGMEMPGLKSLFTRLSVRFGPDADDAGELWYHARAVRFDRKFRLLDTELQVAAPDGRLVATALLRSYVPFSPVAVDLDAVAQRVEPAAARLRKRVALVLGGSRGLGADITAALALAGCHVYASARRDDAARRERFAHLTERGCAVEFLEGDAGDAAWCESALTAIQQRHGRLDVLVLNACAPPTPMRLGRDTAAAREQYVRENLRLVETPLAVMASALNDSGGAIVFVSSSFVDQAPAGFSHYVSVKQAGEGLVRTLGREQSHAFMLIARPPVLRTRWNDTPTGVLGAIPSDWAASGMVTRLAAAWTPGNLEVLSDFVTSDVIDLESEEASPAPDFSLRLVASFTTDPLIPALRFWLKELDINGAVDVMPYGQVLQSLLDPGNPFNGRGRGFNVVMLRVRDWLRELPDEQVQDIEFVRGYLQDMARELEAALRTHRGQASSETLLLICPSHGALSAAESILIRQTETDITAGCDAIPGLHVATASDYHASYSQNEDQIADPLREDIAHIPYRDEYLNVLAAIVARRLYRRMAPVRKVVVADCDNTLWKGVVGEVGPEGLEFDESHLALHDTLARLSASGVLVCLCSKNEEPDVWRVFESRSDMRLKREHVVAAMINWLPKSANLRTLAGRLNLGLDSFVFVDDNPVECAEVRAGCPEVLTIQWPQEPGAARQLLQHLWEFDPSKATKEDQKRTAMYRDEFRRQELRAETRTFEDFLRDLKLTVDFSPLTQEDLRRAAQLTLRTNQFNFTTIRREEADLQALATGGGHEIRTIRVRDRFGDYGLVGLMIAERGAEEWGLDTFLLSCRVLGRGVEHRILSDLGQMAAASGASRVKLRIEKTKRNTPARSFLESVVPSELRHGSDERIEAEVPADVLSAVTFEPGTASEAPVAEDDAGGTKDGHGAEAVGRLRQRERQIARIAFDLATGAAMKAALEGRPSKAAASAASATGDIAGIVHTAFASALAVPIDRVIEVDRLEDLGCDSLRVVEITVALSEKFPWLPSTLLFEHRRVSQIVEEIARLAAGGGAVPAAAIVASPATSTGPLPATNDIAVVGMHVRCAGANSPDELWRLLSGGTSAVTPVPTDRRHFLHPLEDTRPHWAGLLDDPARFDAALFGVSPREAEFMDPQLRLFLEVAWNALEDAGYAGADRETDTGVFAGVMYGDYGALANQSAPGANNPYRSWEGFSLANRLSQLLGFSGPSLAVDTACSSSGTALHLACRALAAGDCRVAVVGGVNLILDPDRFGSLARLGILSTRGQCEPFGADADGTVLGEGAGVVVLRPLDEALRRGDRIHGVIKGTGLSTGSGTVGFTAPNPQAQSEAIRRGLRAARIDPRTVTYVETHGTGTALGDPIEVRGLTLGYSAPDLQDGALDVTHRCRIGSIKPNIGHLEAGAGIVGLIKVLLQMRHGMLVPSITSRTGNPQIPFGQIPFDVQRELAPWERLTVRANGAPHVVPRRAALSSFGVGGANAHVVIEEPPAAVDAAVDRPDRGVHVLALSAPSDEALRRQAASVRSFLESSGDDALADVCFSVNTSRASFDRRLAVAASTRAECLERLGRFASGVDAPGATHGVAPITGPKVAFLFTGQGSQYAGMGRQLYETQPVFRAALDRCAAVLDAVLERPLVDLLFGGATEAEQDALNQTGNTQPALFAIQYALSELWRSWGVTPDVVLGHSVGELAAMCVAGGLSLDDGLKLVAARGRLMQALPPGGTMLSVMAAEDRVLKAIAGREDLVAIAAINAPGQIVISGAGTTVADIGKDMAAEGIKTKALTVSHAFHSPLMKPMLEEYERVVRQIRFMPPSIPLVSCVDGVVTDEITSPRYWLRQVMEPVRFTTAMKSLQEKKVTACVEIGPKPVLLGMGRQCVPEDAAEAIAWVPSMRADADNWQTMAAGVSALYVQGATVDWKGFDAPYARTRVSVPGYAFDARQHWLKRRDLRVRTAGDESAASESTGPAESTVTEVYELAWRKAPVTANAGVTGRWVLLSDDAGIGDALADRLANAGARVAVVRRGDRFADEGNGRYRVNPENAEDFGWLWTAVAPSNEAPPSIVHLWGTESPPGGETRSLVGLVHAAQMLASATAGAQTQSPPRLWVVTQGAVAVAADEGAALAQAPLWGLARTAALEHPELWGGIVDLSAGALQESELAALVRELGGSTDEDQIALRREERYVPRLQRQNAAAPARVALDPSGTYLVTGGLGALGLQMAGWLVRHGAKNLTLVSRKAARDEGALTAIAGLERSGAKVTVAAADVASAADVDALLARIAAGPAPLRGIVHAAGVDKPVPLAQLTAADIQQVLSAKVTGGRLLHERTRGLALDLFLCFSSISSLLGSAGRAHYGAANAFLDALAIERRRQGLPALSVNWGPWSGGGMASPAQQEQFDRIGNYALSPDDALRALDRIAGASLPHAAVVRIDWARFRTAYEARRPRPLVSEMGAAAPGGATPAAAASAPEWVARLAATPAEDRQALLVQLLQAEVADTLGLDSPEAVHPDRSLYQLGMDSLMMADLIARLRKRLGFSTAALVFDHPMVAELTSHLLGQIALPAAETTAAPAQGPAPATATVETRDRDGIDGYTAGVDDEVVAFQKAAWPRRRADWVLPRWRWMSVDSARRLGVDPRIWLYRDAGQVVGYTGAIPVRVKIGPEVRNSAWLVDTMVLEAYRSKAVGSRIMVQAHEDLPFALSLGQTAEMREVQLRLGWRRVAALEVAQLLIRPENVLKGKLPWPAAVAAGLGLRASSAVRDLLRERTRSEVREVSRFDDRHDRLWASASSSMPCAVVRDASYLNWKYVDQPGQEFLRLEIVEAGEVKGIAVLSFREPDDVYQYRRAFLVDLVAPLGDESRLAQLLEAASAAAAERGADALTCLHIGAPLTKALRQHGFRLREPERYLLVDPGDLEPRTLDTVLSADSWFVTHGDSDIDRPW